MKQFASKRLLLTLALVISSLSFSQQALAQRKNVTLKAEKTTVAKLIKEVERQTDYLFVYNQNDVNPGQTVNVKADNEPAIKVLSRALAGTGVEPIIEGGNIVLKKIYAKTEGDSRKTVTGKVVDDKGQPLAGVYIIEQGTTNGVATDLNGNYSILVPADAVLECSSMGFATATAPVSGKSSVSFTLAVDTETLDDVIVIGYGTAKKRDYIGSVSNIKAEEMMKSNPISVESALQGMATGVQVNSGVGIPGAPQQVKVRGVSSISSGTDPLWIVDGIPVQSSSIGKSFDGETGQSVLSMLNPNDIASIQVLKDAAATSIYGSRGSNGVILVTTKSGATGKVKINVDIKSGLSTWAKSDIGLADTSDWMKISDIASNNTYGHGYDVSSTFQNLDGITESLTTAEAKNVNTDWVKQISHTGSFYEANVSLSQGTDKLKSYSSIKYRKDNGNLKYNDLETFAGNIKLDYNLFDWVDLSYRMAATYTDNNRIKSSDGKAGAGGWAQINSNALPWYKVYSDSGYNGYWNSLSSCNPLASMDTVNSLSNLKTLNLLTALTATVKLPVDGLSLKGEWGVNYINTNNQSWRSSAINTDGAIARELKVNTMISNYNAYLNYDKSFGENHEINAVLGIENTRQSAHTTDLIGNELVGTFHEIGTPGSLTGSSGLGDEVYLRGYFARANYKFMDRYIINASARRDGISRFTAANRWANFYSGGLGWIVSEEPWFNKSFVNFLKLRGSIGQTGNTNTPSGITSDYWEIDTGPSDSLEGFNSSCIYSIGNPDIKWETTTSYDAGIDFGIMGNRINGSIAYYRQNVKDMLLAVSMPVSAGIYKGNICWENIGAMYNQGVEFELMANIINRKDISWNVGFNISTNGNKVTALDPDSDSRGAGILNAAQVANDKQIRTIIKAGLPYGTYYMPEYAGVDAQKGIPMIYEIKTNDDGTTEHTGNLIPATSENMAANKMILEGKSALPKIVGGLNTTLTFHGFDLYALFSFAAGQYIYSRLNQSAMTPNAGMLVMKKSLLTDSWEKAGDVTDVPQINAACVYYYDNEGNPTTTGVSYGTENKTPISRFLEKGDYLKLRNLTIGYTLPIRAPKETGVQSVRFYLSGSNLFTLTPFSGYDPEIDIEQSTGAALETFTAMPSSRVFTLGVNLNF